MCCAGLLTGLALGQVIGGPWTLLGPGIGFALGLLADTKIMKSKIKRTAAPVANTTHGVVHKEASMACCRFPQSTKERAHV